MKQKSNKRRTQIIATLGPASQAEKTIAAMRGLGVDIFRVNLSHGTRPQQRNLIRRAAASGGKVMIDLCGDKIRVQGASAPLPTNLITGQRVRLLSKKGRPTSSSVDLWIGDRIDFKKLRVDEHVLLDDGNIVLRITSVKPRSALTVVEAPGRLQPHKGVALPSKALKPVLLTEQDREALVDLANEPFDLTAASFVRSAKQVSAVKQQLKEVGAESRLMAKIEDTDGVGHAKSILEVADGLLIGRGDLGVSMPLVELPFVQKRLIALANQKRKPVIVATQMLESMIHNSRPTRAEVTDVANAVLDGADALMLSAETAVGKYPQESVTMMAEIIAYAEKASKKLKRS